MGFPVSKIITEGISEAKLGSMVGEGVHLGCAALAIALTFSLPRAPWLKGSDQGASLPSVEPHIREVEDPTISKRRRRMGLLRKPSLF
jgi:hypothetical protein